MKLGSISWLVRLIVCVVGLVSGWMLLLWLIVMILLFFVVRVCVKWCCVLFV